MTMPQAARAVVPDGIEPVPVSPVPASIPIALEAATKLINAMLCVYAHDLVGDEALRAARNLIRINGGTLSYVATTLETIRKAQADCAAQVDRNPKGGDGEAAPSRSDESAVPTGMRQNHVENPGDDGREGVA